MTLRRRVTVAATVAVAAAVALACGAAYVVVRYELLGQVDHQLRVGARLVEDIARAQHRGSAGDGTGSERRHLPRPRPEDGGPRGYVQRLTSDARVQSLEDAAQFRIPIDELDRDIAAGRRDGDVLRDVRAEGVHLRVLTVDLDEAGALQLAQPLNSVDTLLARTRWLLAAIALAGVLLAAALGRLVTRRVTAPLREVADAVEHIAQTDDLRRRIAVRSPDDVGRLAWRFNSMLDRLEAGRDALAASAEAQRQLVADASHELRTPVTSLRTNIEVLLDGEDLDPASREELLGDVRAQTEDLSALVADIIELARGDVLPPSAEPVRLDDLVAEAVERAERDHPHVRFRLRAAEVEAEGSTDRLGRAVLNLLDNAAKHTRQHGLVDVAVDRRGVHVRDHGPGIEPEDLPHIFDRFYRGSTAYRLPGTGLGLAIVRQVAEAHDGRITAENTSGGGAVFRLLLPRLTAGAPAGEGVGQSPPDDAPELGPQTVRSASVGDRRAARSAG